jgi:hypothetical protein
MYHWESILAVGCLPQSQNNNYRIFGVLQLFEEIKKILAVRLVGPMTHGKCRVDRPFPYHMTGVV